MERVMDKKREDAIVDAPRYECAEMATRFALSWLDRTRYHLKHIKRGKRSYYHDKLLVEVTAIEQALVDLAIKTNRAYDGCALPAAMFRRRRKIAHGILHKRSSAKVIIEHGTTKVGVK